METSKAVSVRDLIEAQFTDLGKHFTHGQALLVLSESIKVCAKVKLTEAPLYDELAEVAPDVLDPLLLPI